ncbi:protein of unknown function [Methylocella tundrae]|uniref:Uncharacterized protein n=1 Tax=Methylocella tundrae TaxID=227605 RepID=A0A4V6IMV1_METTU|nr:protein of unknown function [Methylocella tundrae]
MTIPNYGGTVERLKTSDLLHSGGSTGGNAKK